MKRRHKKQRLHPDTVTLIKQIALGVLIFALLAAMVYGIWHGTRLEHVTIDQVSVSGGETIKASILEERIWSELDGTYLALIPRRFSYMYPRSDILRSLADIDRIKNVTIDRVGLKKLEVTFTEYQSEALWCTEDELVCYFTDETSFAFAPAPNLQGGAFLRFVRTGEDPVVGKSVFTSSVKQEVDTLIDRLNERGWFVRKIEADSVGDAYLQLVDGGELKIALSDAGAAIYSNLDAVLQSEDYADVLPGQFRYIDLRFGNKVFVNRSFDEVATSTEEQQEEVVVIDEVSAVEEVGDEQTDEEPASESGVVSEPLASSTANTDGVSED